MSTPAPPRRRVIPAILGLGLVLSAVVALAALGTVFLWLPMWAAATGHGWIVLALAAAIYLVYLFISRKDR